MNIFGIGIDIVDTKRIKKIYLKYGIKFAKKILNDDEMDSFNTSKYKISFLAKRFAAKEAIGKACGIGILNGYLLKNISISHNQYGKPKVSFNRAKEFEIYSDKIIHITIADEKKYAIANALILNK